MRESESIGRSPKKADGRNRAKLSGSKRSPSKSNGTSPNSKKSVTNKEQTKTSKKSKMGNGNSVARTDSGASSAQDTPKKRSPRKSNKKSPELRPRRRASQTYFFKYQLARNPLKAEEEDLKLALLASLQQCNGNSNSDNNKNSSSNSGNTKATSNSLTANATTTSSTTQNNNHQKSNKNNGTSELNNHSSGHCNGGKTNGTSSMKHKGKKTDKSNHPPPDKKFKPSIATSNSASSAATANITKVPPEDYLEKYKPETEDFLAFICFRSTAPHFQNRPNISDAWAEASNGVSDNAHTVNNGSTTNTTNSKNNNTNNHNRYADMKHVSIDIHNLKQSASSPSKSNSTPTITDYYSPNNNHRRPTRQSPRLASSQRKISENDSSINNMGIANTAYDNSMNYEEDMKRASIALEDMAQEINSSDGIKKEVAQNSPDCISKMTSSPYKNNKHLVKGLMTREFAGAFADEDTIFESISNHKL